MGRESLECGRAAPAFELGICRKSYGEFLL